MNCLVIRDREAPGSNPGPPTKNRIQNRRLAGSAYPAVSQGRSQIFQELGGGKPVQMDCDRRLNSLMPIAQPIYQHAHGPRTVRRISSKIQAFDIRRSRLGTRKRWPWDSG